MNADDCNGRSYAQGKFPEKEETTIHLCVQSPDFNVYFNNMGIFVFQVMEESHQPNRIFMAGCRALRRDLQTVSSRHHTAPLVVSYPSLVSLCLFYLCRIRH